MIQRCIFVEGIGRVHALGEPPCDFGAMDAVSISEQVALGIRAADILTGEAPGRILWSVRFTERNPS